MKFILSSFFYGLILTGLITGLITGCEVRSIDDDSAAAPQKSVPPALSAEIIEGKMANQFSVKLQMPTEQNFILVRETQSIQDLKINVSEEYLDEQVQAGQTYKYMIGTLIDNNYSKYQELLVKVPQDLTIDKIVSLSPTEVSTYANLRNLTFTSGSILVTNGINLEIRAQNIFSQGGSIQSFTENASAVPGEKGRSGGEIHIEGAQGEGTLSVTMRGENGGIGQPGLQGLAGGDSGIIHLLAPSSLTINVSHIVGSGGQGGQTPAQFSCSRPYKHQQKRCNSIPAGPLGPPGMDGKIGQTCLMSSGDKLDVCQPGS